MNIPEYNLGLRKKCKVTLTDYFLCVICCPFLSINSVFISNRFSERSIFSKYNEKYLQNRNEMPLKVCERNSQLFQRLIPRERNEKLHSISILRVRSQ